MLAPNPPGWPERWRKLVGDDSWLRALIAQMPRTIAELAPKGLYARARRGELAEFTGVNAPYERPAAPALELDSGTESIEGCVERLFDAVAQRAFPNARA